MGYLAEMGSNACRKLVLEKSVYIPTTLLTKYLCKAPFPVREIGTVLTLLHACHVS
jgi:hypothetical protein